MLNKKINFPNYFTPNEVLWCNNNNAYISDDNIKYDDEKKIIGGYYEIKEIIQKLEQLKQLKLQELKSNNEQYIYSVYPQYKQNNIAIFGTKEEKENFTNFIKTQVQKYDVLKEEVKNAKSIEDLDKIGI